jgi:hypothetical protein
MEHIVVQVETAQGKKPRVYGINTSLSKDVLKIKDYRFQY